GYVGRSAVVHTVVHADGTREVVPDPPTGPVAVEVAAPPLPETRRCVQVRRAPLGALVPARSGAQGGGADLGPWVPRDHVDDPQLHAARVAWLCDLVTPERVRALVPEAAELDVEVHPLPNLGGVNVVIHGLLGEGVASSVRFDPQAKALGEWVRSRMVNVDEALL